MKTYISFLFYANDLLFLEVEIIHQSFCQMLHNLKLGSQFFLSLSFKFIFSYYVRSLQARRKEMQTAHYKHLQGKDFQINHTASNSSSGKNSQRNFKSFYFVLDKQSRNYRQ